MVEEIATSKRHKPIWLALPVVALTPRPLLLPRGESGEPRATSYCLSAP